MSGSLPRGKTNKFSLAHRAQQKFNAGKYAEAIDALDKLVSEIAPERDFKVQHNLAVAHFVSGRSNTKEFECELRGLMKALVENATESHQTQDGKFNVKGSLTMPTGAMEAYLEPSTDHVLDTVTGSTVKAPMNGNSTVDLMLDVDKEREAFFIRYNLAAALFIQKEFASARNILEGLVHSIVMLDKKVAMHVCFLYLDIVLHTSRGCVTSELERQRSLKNAQTVMAYLEKLHTGMIPNHGSEQPGMSPETSMISNASQNSTLPSTLNYSNAVTGISSSNITTSSGHSSTNSLDSEKRKETNSLIVVEFKFRLHLYRAKLLLLQSKLKAVKKEMKSALEIFQKEIKTFREADSEDINDKHAMHIPDNSSVLDVQNATALFLKANLEYLRKNYKKCIKLLASCSRDAVDESIFLNNMGCLHFQLGQRRAARSFFARALAYTAKEYNADISNHSMATANSSQYEILYNNGVQLLLRGDHALAFRCLYMSSNLFYNRPKLWLRMGECCTRALAKHQKAFNTADNRSALIEGIIGSGSHRRVILPTRVHSEKVFDSKPRSNSIPGSPSTASDTSNSEGMTALHTFTHTRLTVLVEETPRMNLSFAAKCFRNVLVLYNRLVRTCRNGTASETALRNAGGTTEMETMSQGALDLLRQKALVNLSYVYLCLNEPRLALKHAKEMLCIRTCSKANRYLSVMYATEALCMLSRAAEATEILHSSSDIMALADEYAREEGIQVSQARVGVHVNNATTLLLQGKTPEAEDSVTRAVRENPGCRESLRLLVYVLVKKGDTKKALRVLKEAQVTQ